MRTVPRLPLLFCLVCSLPCEEIDVFEDVDVEIHRCVRSVKPIIVRSPTYDDINSSCEIAIVNNAVPVFGENAFRDLNNLLKLKLINTSTAVLRPGFLNNVANLVAVTVTSNNITEIRGGVFGGLDIKYLRLASNEISVISSRAFDDMSRLVLIDLGQNRLTAIDGRWFHNAPNLRSINLSGNCVERVDVDALRNVKDNQDVDVSLARNGIAQLHARAFENFADLRRLDLKGNKLSRLPDEFFAKFARVGHVNLSFNNLTCPVQDVSSLRTIDNLYLVGNDLGCDCLLALTKFVAKNANFVHYENAKGCPVLQFWWKLVHDERRDRRNHNYWETLELCLKNAQKQKSETSAFVHNTQINTL